MVGSISSVSLVSATSSSTRSSATSNTDLQSQLAAKQQELNAAKTADERKTIQAAIDALQDQIDGQSTSSTGTTGAGGAKGGDQTGDQPPPPPPPPQGNTDNIGKKNFDSSTPFGNREMYV